MGDRANDAATAGHEMNDSLLGKRRSYASNAASTSSGNRYSTESNETGESSRDATERSSLARDFATDPQHDRTKAPQTKKPRSKSPEKGSRRLSRLGHRSHRNRNSGAFLLSHAPVEPPVVYNGSASAGGIRVDKNRDRKGKAPAHVSGQAHSRQNSGLGLGVSGTGSPLSEVISSDAIGKESSPSETPGETAADTPSRTGSQEVQKSLDADSAQIVNLALNLSESRRLASRRNVSTSSPKLLSASFTEGRAAGSLKQHFQQQRRISRNISPRGERSATSPRIPYPGQRTSSPLRPAFQIEPENGFQYQFSQSTLARARKAKESIELMAEYRRLLQFVPPLKPQTPARVNTNGSESALSSPTQAGFTFTRTSTSGETTLPLGRQYNPLQYIRNRKVRARERRAIDGDVQGFGDLEKVSTWVDEVAKKSMSDDYHDIDRVSLPPFPGFFDQDSYTNPTSPGKAPVARIKRPRLDWLTTAPDMLADAYWLEQDAHKRTIEDRYGHKIFPPESRAGSLRKQEDQVQKPSPESEWAREGSDSGLKLDTKLPKFHSVRSDSDRHHDIFRGRRRQKLYEVTRIGHGHPHHASGHDHHLLPSRSRSSSSSSSSDSDGRSPRRRGRSDTMDSEDRGKDILEKQMMEMLAKEEANNQDAPRDVEGQQILNLIEASKPALRNGYGHDHQRRHSVHPELRSSGDARQDSGKYASDTSTPPRQSLEVPRTHGRRSLEDYLRRSPELSAYRLGKSATGPVPGSSPSEISLQNGRHPSPTRKPLSHVRSKISISFRDRSREHRRAESFTNVRRSSEIVPSIETTDSEKRSSSPSKMLEARKTNESAKSSWKARPKRKPESDETSGLRGLFRSGRSNLEDALRSPVSKVSSLLWGKEASPGTATSYDSDRSEDSDSQRRSGARTGDRSQRDGSPTPGGRDLGNKDSTSPEPTTSKKPSYSAANNLPSFTSPFDRRLRDPNSTSTSSSQAPHSRNPQPNSQNQATRQTSGNDSTRFQHLKPPRIDVQTASPASSPDFAAMNNADNLSDISDQELDSRRGSRSGDEGPDSDARLRDILAYPGAPGLPTRFGPGGRGLPVTGLARLQASVNAHNQNNGHDSNHGSREHHNDAKNWSVADTGVMIQRSPTSVTRGEITRVAALLMCTGIKARVITQRAAAKRDLRVVDPSTARLAKENARLTAQKDNRKKEEEQMVVPHAQLHILQARILSTDVQVQSRRWQESADGFMSRGIDHLLGRASQLGEKIGGASSATVDNEKGGLDGAEGQLLEKSLMGKTRRAADEADEVVGELVEGWTLSVKNLGDGMERMVRRRGRRFKWIRRAGWLGVEWMLVGGMWWVWLVVVLVRVCRGLINGVVGGVRWLLWL